MSLIETTAVKQEQELECTCLLCKMKLVILQNRYVPWISLARIFYLSLMTLYPSKIYFSVKTDVPDFIQSHWSILSQLSQFGTGSRWRKSMLDAINHSRFFQSGKCEYHVSGYWRLKDTSMPFIENWVGDETIITESSKSEVTNTNSGNTNSGESSVTFNENVITQSIQSNSFIQNNEIIRNYYLQNIENAQYNIQYLLSIYNQVDVTFQHQIQIEIQMNEKNIEYYSQGIYRITDVNEQNYSSACFMTKTVF
ncbi:hypothetical protein ENUP19_0274G0031 [Entamoeba nuttalli]|uniref:Uncharacterized protein n=2 Tax=Entamoeba nuttalli TaxID=412467 RepID=K2GDU3_ENTNP|nr:hypothetical protein ENU1_081570 [Entamoeba nuttalli P19]EKE40716.1 hypothetical protein ENU1_081570 [Entamoeba nuttalli P19]|eukprot:XP_008856952.1 hypothetical protein ENU1_081570 [Entamoeba nuttalli P19]